MPQFRVSLQPTAPLPAEMIAHTDKILINGVIYASAEGEAHSNGRRMQSTDQNVLHELFLSAMHVVHTDPWKHHQDPCLLCRIALICQ